MPPTDTAAEKDRKALPLWAWLSAIVVLFAGLLYVTSQQKEPTATVAPAVTGLNPGPNPLQVVPPLVTPPSAYPDLGMVHFDTDQAAVTPDMQATLLRAVVVMKTSPAAHLRLEGYTDSVGTEPHNLTLSQRRRGRGAVPEGAGHRRQPAHRDGLWRVPPG
jgi:hypothetical protein